MTIIYAIVLLGILIFVHELGHFLFAKLMRTNKSGAATTKKIKYINRVAMIRKSTNRESNGLLCRVHIFTISGDVP